MRNAERKRRQAVPPTPMDVWMYMGGDYEQRWAQFVLTPKDVQERIGPLEVQLRHLVGGDGRSYLLIAGLNLLDDFRRFIKGRASLPPG